MDYETHSINYDIRKIDKSITEKISLFLEDLYPNWNRGILDIIEEVEQINIREQKRYENELKKTPENKWVELLEYKTSELIFNSKWKLIALINKIWKVKK